MMVDRIEGRNMEAYARLMADLFSHPPGISGKPISIEQAREMRRLKQIQPEEYPAVAEAIDEAMLRLEESGGSLVQRAFNALKLRYALSEPNSRGHTYQEIATSLPRYSKDSSLGPVGVGVSPNRARELVYRSFRKLRWYGISVGIYGFGGSADKEG